MDKGRIVGCDRSSSESQNYRGIPDDYSNKILEPPSLLKIEEKLKIYIRNLYTKKYGTRIG